MHLVVCLAEVRVICAAQPTPGALLGSCGLVPCSEDEPCPRCEFCALAAQHTANLAASKPLPFNF